MTTLHRIETTDGGITLRMRSNSWAMRKQINGQRFEKSLGTTDLDVAIRRATEYFADLSALTIKVQSIIQRASGHCELTGIPFSYESRKHWSRAPYSPSLDRIESRLGYSLTNCRLICTAANWALSDWGDEVFEKVALSLACNRLKEKINGANTGHR